MSWIDIGVGSGSSGSSFSSNLLSGFVSSLGDALSNASSSGGYSRQFPYPLNNNENEQVIGYYYYQNPLQDAHIANRFLDRKNRHVYEKLRNFFERVVNIGKRTNSLNQEIHHTQERINHLNNDINHLNQQIQEQNQALNSLNQEIAGLGNQISAQQSALKEKQEKLNALELETNAKKQVLESLKKLEKLKQELKRLKKQSKWKKQFNFLTDNPPNKQAQKENALNRSSTKNALTNFFLTDPYAILPKGFIYEYHNPGKETYNALNAPNNMDGINNQFRTNALNQVLDNSYQKFLPGNDSYNALGDMEQVKALKFYDLILNFNLGSDHLESALFFKQISQYAKGLRHKILTAPSSEKESERLFKLEENLNQLQEQLKGKDLNTLQKEIEKEQENALKLKENIKAIQNHTETLKNAINQKEQAKNPIQQQKQNLENQKQPLEQQKQNQQSAKWQKEQEKQNLNNEINAIGNERITMKEFYNHGEYSIMGIRPVAGMAVASFRDTNKSVREIYEKEKRIYEILGFWRLGATNERILKRFLELTPEQQKKLAELLIF
ncbi:UV radiation resistance protein [Helicobacter pylori]|uniref:UV radiation resistance protein n=1 Tax=Helicobacter pylori TaxID=210 RepID=UPI0011C9262D|nr:UV radiation resistance protein [Helicobacter pylori]QEE97104.1 UV radiation resistance protein [Helicobacter pylori]QEE98113.1 UV radiation resistance protein [Helicobacter pylori]